MEKQLRLTLLDRKKNKKVTAGLRWPDMKNIIIVNNDDNSCRLEAATTGLPKIGLGTEQKESSWGGCFWEKKQTKKKHAFDVQSILQGEVKQELLTNVKSQKKNNNKKNTAT